MTLTAQFATLVFIMAALLLAEPIPTKPNDLKIWRNPDRLEVKLCTGRDYVDCKLEIVQTDECHRVSPEIDNKSRSIMLPDGASCKIYDGSDCKTKNRSKKIFLSASRRKSDPDLRECLFGNPKWCTSGMELSVSSLECSMS